MKKIILAIAAGLLLLSGIGGPGSRTASAAESGENAAEPGAFYAFDQDLDDKWIGENEVLDSVLYDPAYEAMALRTYNMGWANRFGGVAIKGIELGLPVSPTRNRFMVISLIPDEICAENAFDNLMLIYYKTGSETVYYGTGEGSVDPKALAGIHGASTDDFTQVIVDLAWEEEFSLDTLRLDMFSSSLGVASSDADGAFCGNLYIRYIAFFDTREAAESFRYPPEEQGDPGESGESASPGETTPASETGKPEETPPAPETGKPDAPVTEAPEPGKQDSPGGARIALLIGLCAVVAAGAVAVIVWIVKKK